MEINVKHIAKLAMLKLPEDQMAAMEQEFTAFIEMAERLPKPEPDDMQEQPEDRMTLREDSVVPSYPREVMLQNAPRTAEGCIVVPKIAGNAETSVKTI